MVTPRSVPFLLVGILLFSLASAQQCVLNVAEPYRLPQTMSPTHYDLTLEPTLTAPYSIQGLASIDLTITQDTSCVVLHAAELTIENATLNTLDSSSIEYDGPRQFVIIHFPQTIPHGMATLKVSWNGFLNTHNATGFFVSPLEIFPSMQFSSPSETPQEELVDGNVMLATQFEGPYARMAYPCFDEPAFKATFQVTMIVPAGLTALTNTRETSIQSNGGFTTFNFQKTPIPISSYLVAFSVGSFDFVETNQNGIRFRVYTAPGKASLGQFALNITVPLINYWSDLWGIGYPFDKLDQISVPRLIQDGMENIGLITYWPGYLLADPTLWTTTRYQENCQVIAHELSHLWFGDTVTMAWWSQTYNNEGFARYLQYVGCNEIFPEWNSFENGAFNFFDFAYSIIQSDALGTLHPEVVPDDSISGSVPSVKSAFAGPTYPKGASLNRMFNVFMGDAAWNGALGFHLNHYAGSNPTVLDLLQSLDDYTSHSLDIVQNFYPWLTLSGFPVVTLNFDKGAGVVNLTQTPCSRYLLGLEDRSVSYQWWVPLALSPDGSLSNLVYVNFTEASATFPVGSGVDFVQGNALHTSYLLVNYADQSQWDQVFQSMVLPTYDVVLRNLLVQDVFLLSQMSFQTAQVALSMTEAFAYLQQSAYWNALLPRWFTITVALDTLPNYERLANQVSFFLQPILQFAASPSCGADSNCSALQENILFYNALYGDQAVINYFLISFRSSAPITPNQEKAAYWSVGRYGNVDQYEQLFALYSSSAANPGLQENILFGLTGPQNLLLCNQTLFLLDKEFDLDSRLSHARNMLAYNPFCRSLAWDYIQFIGTELFERDGASAASTVLNSFKGVFSTDAYFQSVAAFLKGLHRSSFVTSEQIRSALVSISINVDIQTKNLEWFQ